MASMDSTEVGWRPGVILLSPHEFPLPSFSNGWFPRILVVSIFFEHNVFFEHNDKRFLRKIQELFWN